MKLPLSLGLLVSAASVVAGIPFSHIASSLSHRDLNVSRDVVAVSSAPGAPTLDLTGLYNSGQCTFDNGTLKATSNLWAGYGFQAPKSKRATPVTPIVSNKGKHATGGNKEVKNYIRGFAPGHAHDFQPYTISSGSTFYTTSQYGSSSAYYNFLLWSTYWSDRNNPARSPLGTATIPVNAAAANLFDQQVKCNAVARFDFSNTGGLVNTQTLTLPGGRYFTIGFVSTQPLGTVTLWGFNLNDEAGGKAKLQILGTNDFAGQTQGLWTFANEADFKMHFAFEFRQAGAQGIVLLLDNGLMCPAQGC